MSGNFDIRWKDIMIEHYLNIPSRLSDSHSKDEKNFKVPTLFK